MSHAQRYAAVGRRLSYFVVALGACGIAGWAFNLAPLRAPLPGTASMKMNTALSFVFIGVALLALAPESPRARRRMLGRAAAAAALLLTALTLAQDLFACDLGIDELLVHERPTTGGAHPPGRMSPVTATCFVLLGLGVLLLDLPMRGRIHPAELTSFAALLLGSLALVGYVYGERDMYAFVPYRSVALHTAVGFVAAGVAVLHIRPTRGLMRELTDPGIGGAIARRLFPVFLLLPSLNGWLCLQGQRGGWFSGTFALAAAAFLTTAMFCAVLTWRAFVLNRLGRERDEALQRFRASDSALRCANQMWEGLIESAPNGILLVGGDGRIERVNAQCERLFGYARDQLVGQPVELLVPERVHARHASLRRAYCADPHPRAMGGSLELYARRRDGTEFPVEVMLNPTQTDRGLLVQVIVSDISERKAASEALALSEERFRLLVDGVSDYALVMLDLEGRVVQWNRGAQLIFGYDSDQIVGQSHERFFTPEDRQRGEPQRELCAAASSGRCECEAWRQRADGTRFWVNAVTTALFDPNGRLRGFATVTRDVSERRAAQLKLERFAEELKRSNEELERFAYAASHDLREPLRTVASFARLLAGRCAGKLGPEADEFLAYIVDGSSRMQALIDDLLKLSRVGTQGRAFEPVDAGDVLARVLNDLAVVTRESGAQITHDKLPIVLADPRQLAQLLQNLLANAIKFHAPGRTPRVALSAEPRAGEWLFRVTDDGIGIDPHYFERIFAVFQRLHTREEYPGTGIGLAMCKKIVERHGGRIWVESRPGQGSTFLFTLPAAPGAAPPAGRAGRPPVLTGAAPA